MKYNEILRVLAINEKTTQQEIENEMKIALKMAGLTCSPKEFIEQTATTLTNKTIYSKSHNI